MTVVSLDLRRPGKRLANTYCIQINPVYMQKMLKGFRGHGSAEFFRQHTDELWEAQFSAMTCAEYGAFRRILAMFARSKKALKEKMIVVTKKELQMHGISVHLLTQVGERLGHVNISLLTGSGEIKDL
ncbi:MAG: hypothetical protein IH838_00985 [Proteobacteria bacterium]|nr:hypothetical protein [Pseudomonadota bacterium]